MSVHMRIANPKIPRNDWRGVGRLKLQCIAIATFSSSIYDCSVFIHGILLPGRLGSLLARPGIN